MAAKLREDTEGPCLLMLAFCGIFLKVQGDCLVWLKEPARGNVVSLLKPNARRQHSICLALPWITSIERSTCHIEGLLLRNSSFVPIAMWWTASQTELLLLSHWQTTQMAAASGNILATTHTKCQVRITQLKHYWIPDPQKLWNNKCILF